MLAWPPEYSIKSHPRTRHVKLKASLKNGLELIVPPRFNLKKIPEILVENREWIEKHLLKIALDLAAKKEIELPQTVYLRALNQTWNVQYIECNSTLRIISRPHFEVAIIGKIQNKIACLKLLVIWLKKLAKTHLAKQLDLVSEQIALPYAKITVRDQQTRWGSCTRDKNISLNYRILFLPEHLARHIMIHELCHTVHLNHSDHFWKLVAKFDLDWKANKSATQKVNEFVPERA